jgi:hypothetical protein
LHVTWQVWLVVQVSVALTVVAHAAQEPAQQIPPLHDVPSVLVVWLHTGPLGPVQSIVPVVHALFVPHIPFCVHAPHVPLSQ